MTSLCNTPKLIISFPIKGNWNGFMLFLKENSAEIHSCLNEIVKQFQIWATSPVNLSGCKREVKIIFLLWLAKGGISGGQSLQDHLAGINT